LAVPGSWKEKATGFFWQIWLKARRKADYEIESWSWMGFGWFQDALKKNLCYQKDKAVKRNHVLGRNA